MDNLRRTIELLFTKRDVKELMNKFHGEFDKDVEGLSEWFSDEFQNLCHDYSGDQVDSLVNVMEHEWMKEKNIRGLLGILQKPGEDMLEMDSDLPICKFDEYLRWHHMTSVLGEDIFTTSFLSARDYNNFHSRVNFAWKPNLTTNNHKLNTVFENGLAELHFHLMGSSAHYYLSWISLMNRPWKSKRKHFRNLHGNKDFFLLVQNAAIIRLYLYQFLNGDLVGKSKELSEWLHTKGMYDTPVLFVNKMKSIIESIVEYKNRIFGECIYDYAASNVLSEYDRTNSANYVFMSERKFLYECFLRIHKRTMPQEECWLFYVYLVAKTQFRNALIQSNNRIGFKNFKAYETYKMDFIKNTKYETLLVNLAARMTVDNQHIKYIEFRITPKDTERKLKQSINTIKRVFKDDRYRIGRGSTLDDVYTHFILHFIKNCDAKQLFDDEPANCTVCRNEQLRNKLCTQTYAVKSYFECGGSDVVGIDAANSEFGCRPEVFGSIFRLLTDVFPCPIIDMFEYRSRQKLCKTFHVGEDYYDIVDGLRAIDEAVLFLELTDGDRLGHATAVGIDPTIFYGKKNRTLVIPKQDLLDNCAWLLQKVHQYGFNDDCGLVHWIEMHYQQLSREIYGSHIPLCDYYQSWLLRGDDPMLYQTVDVEKIYFATDLGERYKLLRTEEVDNARSNKRACELYNRYHYDSSVKCAGYASTQFKIEKSLLNAYINLVRSIQNVMQRELVRKNIFVESNLTSNLRISDISQYDEHPIVRLYSDGLERNDGKECASAGVCVSINTDDQGIFATSLEKEYTLMALALLKCVDKNGMPLYKPNSVYKWIENVRQNAFIQKFGKSYPPPMLN